MQCPVRPSWRTPLVSGEAGAGRAGGRQVVAGDPGGGVPESETSDSGTQAGLVRAQVGSSRPTHLAQRAIHFGLKASALRSIPSHDVTVRPQREVGVGVAELVHDGGEVGAAGDED